MLCWLKAEYVGHGIHAAFAVQPFGGQQGSGSKSLSGMGFVFDCNGIYGTFPG
jgi:hypothetical protein